MKNQLLNDLYRSWRKHKGIQLATLCILVATFTTVSVLLTVSLNLKKIMSRWGESVNMTVYLQDGIDSEAVADLEAHIREFKELKKLTYISKEQAEREFNSEMSRILPELSEQEEFGNPFPASFRIDISDTIQNTASVVEISKLATTISQMVGVEDVSYGQDWVKNYKAFISGIDRFGFILVLTLLIGGVLVVGNSLRTSVVQRREEIEILELVGATYSMIRRPYYVEGAVLGFLAGLISIMITYTIYSFGIGMILSEQTFSSIFSQVSFLSLSWIALVVTSATMLGLLGSYFSVRSINDGWSAMQKVQKA